MKALRMSVRRCAEYVLFFKIGYGRCFSVAEAVYSLVLEALEND